MVCNLMDQVNIRKMKKDRKVWVIRWAVGFCIAAIAASWGVIAGILYAAKLGEKRCANLKKDVTKSVDTIEKVVSEITDDKEKD